jgi:hypothetical protein
VVVDLRPGLHLLRLFPALAQGLIAFAVAQAFGERAENQAYAAGLKSGDDDEVI